MRTAGAPLLGVLLLLSILGVLAATAADESSGRLTAMRVTPAVAVVTPGSQVTFEATPLDESGATVSGATVTWDLAAAGAAPGAIEPSGLRVVFTAGASGSGTVRATARAGGSTAVGLATVIVGADQMQNQSARYPRSAVLAFPSDVLGLLPGQGIDFAAQGFDAAGAAVGRSPSDYSWRMLFSLGDTGAIGPGGRFVAGAGGIGIAQVEGNGPASGLRGVATITSFSGVGWNPLPHVEVSPGIVGLLRAGQTIDFEARLVIGGQVQAAAFTWSVPLLVWEAGSVDPATGVFSAARAGAALVEASTVHQGNRISAFALVTSTWGRPTMFGRVVNADGVPVSGARVEAQDAQGTVVDSTVSDAHGEYAVDADPGASTTIVAATSQQSTRITAIAAEDEGANRYDITVAGVIAAPPGAGQWWPYALAGVGIVVTGSLALALLLGGEAAFVSMLLLFMPLYARIKAERMLDHFVRGRIVGLVQAQPGLSYSDLRRLTGVGNGTLGYHLWCLEKTEYVFSRREGKLKAYYPKGFNAPDRGRMLSDPQQRILEVVRNHPGVSQSEIARALGTTRQHVNFNVKHMERLGVLRVVRERGEAHCHPIELGSPPPQPRPAAITGSPSPHTAPSAAAAPASDEK